MPRASQGHDSRLITSPTRQVGQQQVVELLTPKVGQPDSRLMQGTCQLRRRHGPGVPVPWLVHAGPVEDAGLLGLLQAGREEAAQAEDIPLRVKLRKVPLRLAHQVQQQLRPGVLHPASPRLEVLADGLRAPALQVEEHHARVEDQQVWVGHVLAQHPPVLRRVQHAEGARGAFPHRGDGMLHRHAVEGTEVGRDNGVCVKPNRSRHLRQVLLQEEAGHAHGVAEVREAPGDVDGVRLHLVNLHLRRGAVGPLHLLAEAGCQLRGCGHLLGGHNEVDDTIPGILEVPTHGGHASKEVRG
mmetsp:Transcript_12809/g.40199  ORF Transcript_12809/g.40199 Transcript_12809/m.40199 type:complete len:299 (+) Transcript_12809:46-942(+)